MHKYFMVFLAMAACFPALSAEPEASSIRIADFMFRPLTLTVDAGATVTWINEDDEPHTIRSDEGLFSSRALDTHESFSVKLDKSGTYHYICSIHPRMVGTIVVR